MLVEQSGSMSISAPDLCLNVIMENVCRAEVWVCRLCGIFVSDQAHPMGV